MDWEFAKANTLLYFYEYVMRKGEPQKVSNLSCLFGEKEFTKDMRAIVGSSLAGLKILLSEHPYLFKLVDGDFVYLNANEPTSWVAVVDRDSNEETKEYFKHKLLTYGIGAVVPIKSLHGHRSQAPPPIRHTSGIKTAEFKKFLSQHPETFQIVDRNVLLLGFDDLKVDPTKLRSRLPTHGHRVVHNVNYFEPESVVRSGSDVNLKHLCERNCPKICEITNVYSPVQLCVGGIGSKVEVRRNTQIISTVADSLRVTGEIFKFVVGPEDRAVISMSCKGSRTGTYTQTTLLELGTPNGYAFLFDTLTCPQIMTDGGVKAILESDRIVKVIHNCSYKSGNLYEQFKIMLKCVFDTQLANAVLQYQKLGTNVDSVKAVSLYQLIQLYCPFNSVNEPFGRYVWWARERPFTDEMIVYTAREVLALVQLFGCMSLLIEEKNKPLLSALCTEEILAWICSEEVNAQQTKRNIVSDVFVLKGTPSQTTKSSKVAHMRSVASELDYDSLDSVTQLGSTHRRCCDCYADKENQTLSTGDIVMLSKTYDN